MSFLEKWSSEIWPVLQFHFEKLLEQRPAKQETAVGTHYGEKLYPILETKKELRNVTCNLAWTHPAENTCLQLDISTTTVERMALDMYIDTSTVTPTPPASATDVAESAAGDDDGGQRAALLLRSNNKKAWKIPARVPRGYEIQIAVVSTTTEVEKGKFRRLGLDVVVNATWLAMYWAIVSEDEVAEAALSALILDWPFDFHLFEGSESEREANITRYIINLPAAVERLRDFCGLDQGNLMKICGEVRKLIQKQNPGRVAVSAIDVHTWMSNPDNVKWGLYHQPSLRSVKDCLRNWDTLQKMPEVLAIIDQAKCHFGRESLFDFPTKLNNILEKSGQTASVVVYVMGTLYTFMLRKKAKHPFSAADLKEKGGGD